MEKPVSVDGILDLVPFGKDTVLRRCRARSIPHFKDGRNVYFYRSQVSAWWKGKEQKVRKAAGRPSVFNPNELEGATL